MKAVDIRALRPTDKRDLFCSGDANLDRFFRLFAGQNQFRHHIGATYVAVVGPAVLGYITVSASHIEIKDLPRPARRRLPRYPLPVLRLARLAVDQHARSRGIGRSLLKTAFQLAHEMSDRFGCVGIVVDAKPQAVAFYQRHGFHEMEVVQGGLGDRPSPTPMFLPIGSIPRRHPSRG